MEAQRTATKRWEVLAGVAGVATLGAVAAGGAARNITRRCSGAEDPYRDEDFDAIYDDAASIVTADDGVPLTVREVGPADAPITVVFTHGFCLRMSSWHFQRVELEHRWGDRARLVFFDQRGHGRSGAADAASSTIAQLGADLDAVIRAVVPTGPVVVIGHSMGAMGVMALATRRPELFGTKIIGVGLISSAARGIADDGIGRGLHNPVVDAFRMSVRQMPGAVQAGRGVTRSLIAPVLTAGSFDHRFRYRSVIGFAEKMIHQTPVATIVNFLRALESHNEMASLAALTRVPTMVACGYQDRITPLANSVEIHGGLADCELVGVPDAGHMLPLECPDVIDDAIDRLVGRAALLVPDA
ncbi:alpha/beta fold hydrolase [Jongsikchunia kroppenstedtii]|uniref:alpha/beta fold hydrolase n=1 Tax=Jongsikchunia kroppenstedtii TaxID=1121721 RepID=UPI0003691011|nr:alpha/beta hydrolase [Jongsikchunia kroppenstedtii]